MCEFSENFIFNKIIPHLKWCSINSIFSIGIWTPQEAPSVIAMDTAQNFTDRKELKTPLFPKLNEIKGPNSNRITVMTFIFLEISWNFVLEHHKAISNHIQWKIFVIWYVRKMMNQIDKSALFVKNMKARIHFTP